MPRRAGCQCSACPPTRVRVSSRCCHGLLASPASYTARASAWNASCSRVSQSESVLAATASPALASNSRIFGSLTPVTWESASASALTPGPNCPA